MSDLIYLRDLIRFSWKDRKSILSYLAKNWRSLSKAKVLNYVQARRNEEKMPPHIAQQVRLRISLVEIRSPKCLEGKCVHCGCETPGKFYEPNACENGCYPEIMSQSDWENKTKI